MVSFDYADLEAHAHGSQFFFKLYRILKYTPRKLHQQVPRLLVCHSQEIVTTIFHLSFLISLFILRASLNKVTLTRRLLLFALLTANKSALSVIGYPSKTSKSSTNQTLCLSIVEDYRPVNQVNPIWCVRSYYLKIIPPRLVEYLK